MDAKLAASMFIYAVTFALCLVSHRFYCKTAGHLTKFHSIDKSN